MLVGPSVAWRDHNWMGLPLRCVSARARTGVDDGTMIAGEAADGMTTVAMETDTTIDMEGPEEACR